MPSPGPKFNLLARDCSEVRDGLDVEVVVLVLVVVVLVKEITVFVGAGNVLLKGGDEVVRSISDKDSVMAASVLPATFFALQW